MSRAQGAGEALLAPGGAGAGSRRSQIGPFVAMDVLREANAREAAGEKIVHMEVGQPAAPAPRLVREAARSALETGRLGYTEARGIAPLRERIARHYHDAYGVTVAPERIIITTGSSAGFVLAFLALFDVGARVALPEPGYPCYRQILGALELNAVAIPARGRTRWMPTPQTLDAAARENGALDGLILASPANPTGTMLSTAALAELAGYARTQGIALISDEIYHGLCYAAPAQTALAVDPDAIIINSFSKYYAMTGWRIGWVIVPEAMVRTFERLHQNLYICAPVLSQIAAIAAFDATEELERIKEGYARNRALLLNELPSVGFADLAPADGAFYLYADVSERTDDARAFAARMLRETGVAVTPGIDFDASQGHHFIRFSYAGGYEDMAEAIRRLKSWRA